MMTDEEAKEFFGQIGSSAWRVTNARKQAKNDVYMAAYGGSLTRSSTELLQRVEQLAIENAKLKEQLATRDHTIRNLNDECEAMRDCASMLRVLEKCVWRDARTQSYTIPWMCVNIVPDARVRDNLRKFFNSATRGQ